MFAFFVVAVEFPQRTFHRTKFKGGQSLSQNFGRCKILISPKTSIFNLLVLSQYGIKLDEINFKIALMKRSAT